MSPALYSPTTMVFTIDSDAVTIDDPTNIDQVKSVLKQTAAAQGTVAPFAASHVPGMSDIIIRGLSSESIKDTETGISIEGEVDYPNSDNPWFTASVVATFDAFGVTLVGQITNDDPIPTLTKNMLGGQIPDALQESYDAFKQITWDDVGVAFSTALHTVDLPETGNKKVYTEDSKLGLNKLKLKPGVTIYADMELNDNTATLAQIKTFLEKYLPGSTHLRCVGNINLSNPASPSLGLMLQVPVQLDFGLADIVAGVEGQDPQDYEDASGISLKSKYFKLTAAIGSNIKVGFSVAFAWTPGKDQDPINLGGEFEVSEEEIGGALSMEGDWQNAFLIPGLTLSDVAIELEVNTETLIPTTFGMTGSVVIAGDTQLDIPREEYAYAAKISVSNIAGIIYEVKAETLDYRDLAVLYLGVMRGIVKLAQDALDGDQEAQANLDAILAYAAIDVPEGTTSLQDKLRVLDGKMTSLNQAFAATQQAISRMPSMALHDVEIYFSPTGGEIGTIEFPPGMLAKGTIDVELDSLQESASFGMSFAPFNATLQSFFAEAITMGALEITKSENSADLPGWFKRADLPKWLTQANEDFEGPVTSIKLSLNDPKVYISGHMALPGFAGDVLVTSSSDGTDLEASGKLANILDMDVTGQWSASQGEFSVQGRMSDKGDAFIQEAMKVAAQKAATEGSDVGNTLEALDNKLQQAREALNHVKSVKSYYGRLINNEQHHCVAGCDAPVCGEHQSCWTSPRACAFGVCVGGERHCIGVPYCDAPKCWAPPASCATWLTHYASAVAQVKVAEASVSTAQGVLDTAQDGDEELIAELRNLTLPIDLKRVSFSGAIKDIVAAPLDVDFEFTVAGDINVDDQFAVSNSTDLAQTIGQRAFAAWNAAQ